MLAMPAGIPAGMVADAPVLRIPCLRAPQPEPIVRRQPHPIEYPREGGLYDDPYGRSPHETFFRHHNPVSNPSQQHPPMPPRVMEHHHMVPRVNEHHHHHHMQHKVHKSYIRHQRHRSGSGSPTRNDPLMASHHAHPAHHIHGTAESYIRHQRNRSGSGSPPRNDPLIASHPAHHIHGTAQRPPRMQNINTPSNYAAAPSLQKPDFSLREHETLLRQAAMRAVMHSNGNRQSKPPVVVERPVRHPLPNGRPIDPSKERVPPVPRQTRRMLTDREKMDICLFHEHHRSFTHKDIADKFGVERTTVTKILLNKQQHMYPQQN